MIVQIYEIQTPEEAERCIALGVDHIGSVLLSCEAWQQPKIREVIRLSQGTSVMNSLIPLFRDIDIISRVVTTINLIMFTFAMPFRVLFPEEIWPLSLAPNRVQKTISTDRHYSFHPRT